MTNALGAGTANVTANMPIDEAAIHGQTAFQLDIPRGELIRQALLEWYQRHKPDVAGKIESIRRNHREIGSAFMLALYLGSVAIFGDEDAIKKSHRRPRIVCKGVSKRIEEAFA